MEVPVLDMSGKQVKTLNLPADIFEVEVNVGLMHQAYVRQMANARQGTHKTKTRSEVDMTTAKMYRQKGTGRARHGSRSANLFVGGGIAHGPKPRDYSLDMPRKMRRKAIRCALSALAKEQQLVFVDKLEMPAPKTKQMAQLVQTLTGGQNALVLFTRGNDNVQRSTSNLQGVRGLLVDYLNIRDLLQYDKVIVPLDALDVIQRIWGQEGK
ncbi:MAG: 50S ribosomal protein L4 [Anaerolineae bacterium]|nr:50S ribosomal protein L4 [Anaerolineae bacterium]MDW8173841.1 50S ribosomal protein L4 [Anaerolineae bacterium]